MLYSKYSNYSPDQIMSEDYIKISEYLLSIAKDSNIREKMKRNII